MPESLTKAKVKKPAAPKKLSIFGPNVAIIPVEKETVTPGGVVLPEDAVELEREGVVHTLGADVPMSWGVKEGDYVIFSSYAGFEIELNDGTRKVTLLIMDYKNLKGKVE